MKFEDLRAILQYVPQFQEETFVIALDGALIASPDFSSILLDLAVLRSLDINVILVHGAAHQIEELGKKRKIPLSSLDGTGRTDEATLEVAIDAISRLSHSVLQSLTTVKIRAATANAIHARPAGIIKGEDWEFTGTIDRIDAKMIRAFLAQGIMPVIPPLGFDADGRILRVNSDVIAAEVACAVEAVKVLFLSTEDPSSITPTLQHSSTPSLAVSRQWSSDQAAGVLKDDEARLPRGFSSKLRQAVMATREGVPRIHLVGASQNDALLAELFSNEGNGLMIFAGAYHQVRQARKSDADEIYSLIRRAVENEQLIERSRPEIVSQINDFIVLTIDANIVGCVALHWYAKEKLAELACLFVKRGHNGRGYGAILVEAVKNRAAELKASRVFALSTQAVEYLEKNGFTRTDDLSLLPRERHEKWKASGRNAVVLTCEARTS